MITQIDTIDLNTQLMPHNTATVFFRMSGDAMQAIGLFHDDILIVDRAEKIEHESVVVAVSDGQFVCRILDLNRNCLLTAGDNQEEISIDGDLDDVIEGVVIHSIRPHRVHSGAVDRNSDNNTPASSLF